MTQSEFKSLAQTIFAIHSKETRQFENLVIKKYFLNARIQNEFAITAVEIVFSNPNDAAIKGVFILPIQKKIDKNHLEIKINKNVVPVKSADEKKLEQHFPHTFQQDNFQFGQNFSESVLQTKVLQIEARDQVSVQISYAEVVEESEDQFQYTHPLQSYQPIEDFEMLILIQGDTGVEAINSTSHDLDVSDVEDIGKQLTYQATGVQLDKDFVCTYTFSREQVLLARPENIVREKLFFSNVSEVPEQRLDALSTVKRLSTLSKSLTTDKSKVSSPNFEALDTLISAELTSTSLQRGARRLGEMNLSRENRVLSFGMNPPNDAAYRDMYFKGHGTNPFIDTEDDNHSTFAMDADSASYAITRRYIRDGHLPPPEAVRVEEFVNAFNYNYTPPTDSAFAVYLEGAPSKFGTGKRLQMLRIGIQGEVIPDIDRKNAVLTFVIDVSGSMGMENRLELVKKALRLLVDQLRPDDKIGIVVYGTNARVVLPHTSTVNKEHILEKINSLCPEGVTNVEDGIRTGYELARTNSEQDSINRIILCSDGVANQGITSAEMLLKEIQDYVEDGIYVTTVGFGMGNYNDTLMEELAKKGNGNYAYVDTLNEAKRIFVENLTGTLQVIAKDAKIQVEFNEDTVRGFRLLGYESRQMKHEDFRNDEADAGEIGSGHNVTALYEVKLHKGIDKGKLATVNIRHENPDTAQVTEVSKKIRVEDLKNNFQDTSLDFQFAASVAHFAELLRGSYWVKESNLAAVQRTLKTLLPQLQSKTDKHEQQKRELFSLVREARRIKDMNEA